MDKPNVLFILTDQQRTDTLTCYGGKVCQTPNLDRLAEESVVFTNAYTSCPICTPARSSLQTGYYPCNTGMQTNIYGPGCLVSELQDDPMLLSRQLQQQGYSTGYTGKWHLGSGGQMGMPAGMKTVKFAERELGQKTMPSDVGYEADDFPGHGGGGHRYPQYADYLQHNGLTHEVANRAGVCGEVVSPIESTVDYYLVERAIHYIDRFRRREQPFYFQLNFWGPHEPYLAPSKYLDLYRDMELEPWPNFHDNGHDKPAIHNVKREPNASWPNFAYRIKHYYGFMSAIDEQIGRLIDYLKRTGLYENTVIIFSADHGDALGIHGGLTDKAFFMFEETCRIPLLIKPAGNKQPARRESRFAGTCDIHSTILELAGVPREKAELRDGRSLIPLIRDEPDTAFRDHIVTECSGLGHVLYTQRMIRHGDLKYVFNCGDTDELYDLRQDPYELVNLIDYPVYRDRLAVMRHKLGEWLEEHNKGLHSTYMKLVKFKMA